MDFFFFRVSYMKIVEDGTRLLLLLL